MLEYAVLMGALPHAPVPRDGLVILVRRQHHVPLTLVEIVEYAASLGPVSAAHVPLVGVVTPVLHEVCHIVVRSMKILITNQVR